MMCTAQIREGLAARGFPMTGLAAAPAAAASPLGAMALVKPRKDKSGKRNAVLPERIPLGY